MSSATPDKHMPKPIRYCWGESPLGSLVVASSLTGICYLGMADQPDTLFPSLLRKFPQAQASGDDPDLQNCLETIRSFIDRPNIQPSLGLDLSGTPFQLKVWQFLQTIPSGQTMSYSFLAQGIQAPQAVRAVASACAANPVALLVPCHRVISSNGNLSGYRWGVSRKAELLRRETELQS